jgi:hypothetical protein
MPSSFTRRQVALAAAGLAVINALAFSPLGDQGFFAIALLGPLLTGAAVAVRRGDRRLAALTWFATGLVWLVTDWIVNREDVLFHLVLAFVMWGLVRLGAKIAGAGPRVAT